MAIFVADLHLQLGWEAHNLDGKRSDEGLNEDTAGSWSQQPPLVDPELLCLSTCWFSFLLDPVQCS